MYFTVNKPNAFIALRFGSYFPHIPTVCQLNVAEQASHNGPSGLRSRHGGGTALTAMGLLTEHNPGCGPNQETRTGCVL